MSDKPADDGLYIDSDWKEEAAREKERLAEQEEKQKREPKASGAAAATGPATFVELVNLLAMQAVIALGGLQTPGGERIPPNPMAAKHHIDLLEVMEKKTEGNLTDDEKRMLTSVLYELRMQYVQATTVPQPPPGQEKGKK
ncbi:MAG: DUF1844 domain-containing protein [Phycisphaerae bacterium]